MGARLPCSAASAALLKDPPACSDSTRTAIGLGRSGARAQVAAATPVHDWVVGPALDAGDQKRSVCWSIAGRSVRVELEGAGIA